MIIIQEEIIEVIAEEGMMLTDDNGNYASHLYLGKDDSPSNWHEIPIEEVPQDEQFEPDNLPF